GCLWLPESWTVVPAQHFNAGGSEFNVVQVIHFDKSCSGAPHVGQFSIRGAETGGGSQGVHGASADEQAGRGGAEGAADVGEFGEIDHGMIDAQFHDGIHILRGN